MSGVAWHDEGVRKRLVELVRELESKSAVELVIAVRPRSGDYRAADLAFASLVTFAALAVYVYAPQEFTDDVVPPLLAVLYAACVAFAAHVPPVRRLFTTAAAREANVRAAARAAFVAHKVHTTRDRTGVLLFVSDFERRAEIVADLGVLRRADGDEPARSFAALTKAIGDGRSLDEVVAAARALGAFLERALPRRPDDVNELDDAPREDA
jgi:putative membrane protein